MSFDRFIGIDWSGARELNGQIQVAICEPGMAAPSLVEPPHGTHWKRRSVLDWLIRELGQRRALVGFDFSFTFPFVDKGGYFPRASGRPMEAKELWKLVESNCDTSEDFFAGGFCLQEPWKNYFHHGRGNLGDSYEYRQKVVEDVCRKSGLGRPETVFKLVGPSQVGKGSLSGMRVLLALKEQTSAVIWPFEDTALNASVVVEIFPRLFLAKAGFKNKKVRTQDDLNLALSILESDPMAVTFNLGKRKADDKVDAIVTAAGLRLVHADEALWRPSEMKEEIRRTEGWIFGVA